MCSAVLLLAMPALGRVLVVHSYHEQFDWVQGVNRGVRKHLKPGVEYRIFYMDTKRRPAPASKAEAADKVKKVILGFKPTVIIAVDDNAQKYVVKEYVGRSDIQFVFCGVNAAPSAYGYPAKNVTGILERPYPEQVFQMLKKIVPKAKNVAWVSDDSATICILLPQVKKMANSRRLSLNISGYTMLSTFKQWKQTIAAHEKNPDIHALLVPLYHTLQGNEAGRSVRPSKVMAWTIENTTKPVLGFWPFATDEGALCAVAVDPYEHGKVAALMASRVLAGKRAGDISLVTNQDGYVIVNLKTADRLGVNVPFEVILSADRVIQ